MLLMSLKQFKALTAGCDIDTWKLDQPLEGPDKAVEDVLRSSKAGT